MDKSQTRTNIIHRIFDVNPQDFNQLALDIFHYQIENCPIYKDFAHSLLKTNPKNLEEIPFLPIQFFKSHLVSTFPKNDHKIIFKSSATTGISRSEHHVHDLKIYRESCMTSYKSFIGNPEDHIVYALLPNYLEQGNSSLVWMVDQLIIESKNDLSGFYLTNYKALLNAIKSGKKTAKKLILFGVSYALLDLAEQNVDLRGVTVIETGGMKGRRKEMSKFELHETLKKGLNLTHIASEYGMTELLSQAYSIENELFTKPNWMKILIREVNDPFSYNTENQTGGINVIDLANIDSCSFIETQDLGKIVGNQFQLMGRFDFSDVRGCNLMVH